VTTTNDLPVYSRICTSAVHVSRHCPMRCHAYVCQYYRHEYASFHRPVHTRSFPTRGTVATTARVEPVSFSSLLGHNRQRKSRHKASRNYAGANEMLRNRASKHPLFMSLKQSADGCKDRDLR